MAALDSKIAVVTGGAQGIGQAIVESLASNGAHVAIADVNLDGATALAERLGESKAAAYRLDVTDSSSVREVVEGVARDLGGLDIWVNNAGVVESSATLDMPDEVWDRTIAVDLTGSFYGAREAARHMVDHGGGVILQISSIAAYRTTNPERHLAYDVSKAGVSHMVGVLASEWADHGIRVVGIAPGYTETPILVEVGAENPEIMQQWLSQIAMNRLIDPAEIGRAAAFLASDSASAITGQVVVVDAGFLAR
jgi:NAD(P)-dependent dehydrogenase (short-subunit alcohol dehydrogenase family)